MGAVARVPVGDRGNRGNRGYALGASKWRQPFGTPSIMVVDDGERLFRAGAANTIHCVLTCPTSRESRVNPCPRRAAPHASEGVCVRATPQARSRDKVDDAA
jgi:hypothetical protein